MLWALMFYLVATLFSVALSPPSRIMAGFFLLYAIVLSAGVLSLQFNQESGIFFWQAFALYLTVLFSLLSAYCSCLPRYKKLDHWEL